MKHLTTILCLMAICSRLPLCCQTTLYNQYKHRTDMVVACAMDFPITDSIKTDITMFIPKTKEDLWPMVQEFGLGLDKEEVYNCFEKEEKYELCIYGVYKDNIRKRFGMVKSEDDYAKTAMLAYNYNMGMIMIFHDIGNKERNNVVISFLIETTVNPDILSQYNMNN